MTYINNLYILCIELINKFILNIMSYVRKVQRIGDSLHTSIPAQICSELSIRKGSRLRFGVSSDGFLYIKPIGKLDDPNRSGEEVINSDE